MRSVHTLRFEVPDRDTLERLLTDPLPGLGDAVAVQVLREVFYDTPIGDLRAKGASARLRVHDDGQAEFIVAVVGRTSGAAPQGRSAYARLDGDDARAAFRGDTDPARLLRALIDPARLTRAFELERLRRVRRATPDAPEDLACELITLRHDALAGDLLEAELVPADGRAHHAGSGLAERLRADYGLRPLLTDTAVRAAQLLEVLDRGALGAAVRAAREVAIVAVRDGAIGLLPSPDGGVVVPTGPGGGAPACRRVLRATVGHSQGRIRLIGSSAGFAHRPTIEVWSVEDLAAPTNGAPGLIWVPYADVVASAGMPGIRDARTLAALHVALRAGLNANGRAASEGPMPRVEPVQSVLQRLTGSEPGIRPSDLPDELQFNAELSRIAFDERMLSIVESPQTPLLERVRFLAMFGERRDDFYMSRFARFKAQLHQSPTKRTPDGLSPIQQLDAMAIRTRRVMDRAYAALCDRLLPDLAQAGILIVDWDELSDDEKVALDRTFGSRLEVLLTPIVADPAHPFPHVRNLRPALAAIVRGSGSVGEDFVAVELPGDLPRFVPLPDGQRFVRLETLIEAELPQLYPGLEVVRAHTFRVTRSATIEPYGSGPDVLLAVEDEIERRPFQQVVRLEVERDMPADMRDRLLSALQYETQDRVTTLSEQDLYTVAGLVDLAALDEIVGLDRPELKWAPLERRNPLATNRPIFDIIRERDRLVRFPHDRFEDVVERLLEEAAEDPHVIAVKTTLYRTEEDSGIVAALKRARENGKEAVVLVELKASFDERRNIEWGRSLRAAGIRVVFSPLRYKVHAKTALVVRREGDELRRYVYIGTGNLNAATARSYIDLGLLSADATLGAEVAGVFNLLTGHTADVAWERLLVAPINMRQRFLEMIAREADHARAGRPALIRVQVNGLADRRIIAALYDASRAGVEIRLTVREICTLRPGLPGVSETITVRSVLGRFLQHARIFHFRNGGDDEYYIGSADWRPRNLQERVELITPIDDPEHCATLDRILDDTFRHPDGWELRSDGSLRRRDEILDSIHAGKAAP